jgi:hypothetical protein
MNKNSSGSKPSYNTENHEKQISISKKLQEQWNFKKKTKEIGPEKSIYEDNH